VEVVHLQLHDLGVELELDNGLAQFDVVDGQYSLSLSPLSFLLLSLLLQLSKEDSFSIRSEG
jgi:hypothetical protein